MKTLALLLALAAPALAAETKVFDPAAIDAGVAPCDDFFRHACGGWMKANPIPADQSRWGRFNELAERNKETLRDLLAAAAKPDPKRGPAERRMGDLYAACMDEEAVEAKGAEPLAPVLADIEGLKSAADLPRLLAALHRSGVGAAFSFDSDQDAKDATKVIAAFDQGGLGLPDRDYYFKDDAKSVTTRRQYEWHVAKTFGLLGEDPATAAASAKTVLRVETELARVSMDRVSRRDPEKTYHPMAVSALETLSPGFDWSEYLALTGAPASAWLNVSSTEHAKGFAALAASAPLADWKTYLRWRAAASASSVNRAC